MIVNEETKKLLVVMGFEDENTLPTMKTLRERFRKLAIEKHPDKGGSNEQFKELYSAYEILGKLIASQMTHDEEDSEELEARRMFREENWEKNKSEEYMSKKHNLRSKKRITYREINLIDDDTDDTMEEETMTIKRTNKLIQRCDLCKFSTYSIIRLKTHMRKKHKEMPKIQCNICEFQAGKRKELMVHTKENHGEKQCPVCENNIDRKGSLRKHIEEHHKITQTTNVPSLKFNEGNGSKNKEGQVESENIPGKGSTEGNSEGNHETNSQNQESEKDNPGSGSLKVNSVGNCEKENTTEGSKNLIGQEELEDDPGKENSDSTSKENSKTNTKSKEFEAEKEKTNAEKETQNCHLCMLEMNNTIQMNEHLKGNNRK